MEFPYKISFSAEIKPLVSAEKDKYLAMASLLEIGKFIPEIDTDKNYDLLPVAFNACVVNRVNKNDDGIDTKTALAIYKYFINKPINIEHNRQKVIGVILAAGFSEFGTDKKLTAEEIKDMKGPFNIILGGAIWRVVNPKVADIIEESNDKSSDNYLAISASWELGFHEFNIILLEGNEKNIENGTLITDKEEIEKLTPHLRALGGDGKFEDKRVCRLPFNSSDGRVVPMGVGFTENPAAEVKGVAAEIDKNAVNATITPEDSHAGEHFTNKCSCGVIISQCRCMNSTKAETIIPNGCKKCKENQNNISQSTNQNVTIERKETMKITKLQDITDESLKQLTASVISEFIQSELTEKAKTWESEKTRLENQAAEADKSAKAASKTLEEVQSQLEKVNKALAALEQEKVEREKVELFNTRMDEISKAYELDDEARLAVVEEIKVIASDEDFTKWKKKASILLKGFAKKAAPSKKADDVDDGQDNGDQVSNKKKAKAKELEAALASATSQKEKDSILAQAMENGIKLNVAPPNTTGASEPTLMQKAALAFGKDAISIRI